MCFSLLDLLTLVFLLSFSTTCSTALTPQGNCTSCLPNPIATTYPFNITGTINATTSILLVSLPYARSLLPARLANSILTHAYNRFNIHPATYPIVLEATIDHNIKFNNTNVVSDFSSLRLTFPFIDLLGDGYSNFRYTGYIYLPASNPTVITGSEAYGDIAIPAFFDPPDAPYKSTHDRKRISFAVYAGNSTSSGHIHGPQEQLVASTLFCDIPHISPAPLAFYKNITNQPLFGNNISVCDNMISLWNTTASTGVYAPQAFTGEVVVSPPIVPRRKAFRGIRGIRAQRAFIENNYLPCESLKGYAGTGTGDSG